MTSTGTVRGPLTAREINSFRDTPNGVETSAAGVPVPIAFGNITVPGLISLWGIDSGGDYVYRVFWCAGEIYQIDDVYINGEPLPASAELRHYRGAIHQGVDDLVEDITTLVSYAETMVQDHPAGLCAVAYSVIRLPTGAGTGVPRFQAVVRGSVVYDVRNLLTHSHIFEQEVSYNLDFTQASDGTGTTGVDLSFNAHTVAWSGGAAVSSGRAVFDGNGDYLTLQDTTAADFGTGLWTLEVTIITSDTTGNQYVFSKGDLSSDRAIVLLISSDDLYVYLSSDGTTWDIASAVLLKNTISPTSDVQITVEFTGREYHFYVGGFHVHRIQDDTPLYATTRPVRLGLCDGGTATDGFNGSMTGCRMTKGLLRYGGVHGTIVADPPAPYMDSGNVRPGYIYRNNPALILGELARNPHYGLGVSNVYNELEALEFCEEDLPSGEPRAQFDYVLSSVRTTEAWMDYVATYAETFWFFDDDGVYLKPDRRVTAKRPSGWEMGENGEFLVDDSAWTAGTGWTYYGGDLHLFEKAAGTASSISQALVKPFEAGETYCAVMDVGLRSAGTVNLTLNGVVLIAAVSAAGRYAYEWTATGGEDGLTIACNADSSFVGLIGEVSIRRKYWPETAIVQGSLSMSGAANSDSPTSVTLQYTNPVADSPNWLPAEPVIALMPGVETTDVPLLDTSIDFPGVTRIEEAENKALSRLLRMQNMVDVAWVSADRAIALRRGFVVNLIDPETATDMLVRITSVTATQDNGRYRVAGYRYDDEHYPSETDLPTGTIPVSAITISRDGVIPSGWAAYTAANGKYIKCAGTGITAESTGGAATRAAITGNVVTAGEHGDTAAPEMLPLYIDGFVSTGGSGSGDLYTATEEDAGGHVHTFDTGTITPELYTLECVLVQKITSTSTTMPGNLCVFGQVGLKNRNMIRWLYGAQRLVAAAAAAAASGLKEQPITLTTGSTDDTHEHYTRSATTSGTPSSPSALPGVYAYTNGGGAHTHPATIGLIRNTKKYRLSMYSGTGDYGVSQGCMLLWPNLALPTGYTLCDGLLGTPNLRDYFIEVAAMGEEDTYEGDNTVGVFGYTNYSATHNHQGSSDASVYNILGASHANDYRHRHVIFATGYAWTPEYFALSVIMYNPAPVPTWRDAAYQFSGGTAGAAPTDTGPDALTLTLLGSPTWSSTYPIFGNNAIQFGVNTPNYVRLPVLSLGAKFTMECFFRTSSFSTNVMMGNRSGTTTDRWRLQGNAGNLRLLTSAGNITSGAISLNTWYFVSVNYDGAEWRYYLGTQASGVASLVGTQAQVIASMPTINFWIGGDTVGSQVFVGHIAEIRHTRGVAMRTGSSFAIPVAALTTS